MLKPVVACLLAFLCVPAVAGEAGDLARKHLYAGTLAEGLEELRPFDERYDQEGRFGIGLIKFAQAVEHLAQGLYRHGFVAPGGGPIGPAMIIPVPANPDPEPISYDNVRELLSRLVTDMDEARTALLFAADMGDYVMPVEVLKIRIDLDGDGSIAEEENIGRVLASLFGALAPQNLPPDATIGFDRADAYWLAGYSQVAAAQADYLLAHDFSELVNATFHRLFPAAGLPMQDHTRSTSTLMLDPQTDNAIADALAAIHTLSFPVIEPPRLKRVLERLTGITDLSRRNWEAILLETDDNRELIPNPGQTSLVPDAPVTEEMIAAWLATLDAADRILSGELLVPHWRFEQGFDLKAYFENATRTDFVMLITGYDALPFLKEGPVVSPDTFAEANRVFGSSLWGYAFWFN